MGNIVWEWDVEKMHDGYPHWFVLNSGCFGLGKLYDVLTHPYITELCANSGKHTRFEYFNERLKTICHCEFAGRAQFEMGFTDKFPYINRDEIDRLVEERDNHPDQRGFEVDVRDFTSIDVYNQLFMNWDAFAHYAFEHRAAIVEATKARHKAFKAKMDAAIDAKVK